MWRSGAGRSRGPRHKRTSEAAMPIRIEVMAPSLESPKCNRDEPSSKGQTRGRGQRRAPPGGYSNRASGPFLLQPERLHQKHRHLPARVGIARAVVAAAAAAGDGLRVQPLDPVGELRRARRRRGKSRCTSAERRPDRVWP